MKTVLITGANGFIGSNIAKHFQILGYVTYGLGHGELSQNESKRIGLNYWIKADVSIKSILKFDQKFDIIFHCAGGGYIGLSIDNPYEDFKKTSQSSIEILEYMRLYNPKAHLIFPSSPAVQGECENTPIKENYIGRPVSPYGHHKKIVEELCQSYHNNFSLQITIIRFFSIYGNGLKKQLLWDASKKIQNEKKVVNFFGTGDETRDFLHISDVFKLIDIVLKIEKNFLIINGGTGIKQKVRDIVIAIRNILNPNIKINFNNRINTGNPKYYCANTEKLEQYNFKATKRFEHGLNEYVTWIKTLDD
jgi:UDP-glucose 4-epimerase